MARTSALLVIKKTRLLGGFLFALRLFGRSDFRLRRRVERSPQNVVTFFFCFGVALEQLGTKFNLDEFTAIHWLALRHPSTALAAKFAEKRVPFDEAMAKFRAVSRSEFAASFQEAIKRRVQEKGPFPSLEMD